MTDLPSPPDMGASPVLHPPRRAHWESGPGAAGQGRAQPGESRTLDARGRAITLAHGRMRRSPASGHADPSGAIEHDRPCVQRMGHCASPAMMDRSDQARHNAGPRISIKRFDRSPVNRGVRRHRKHGLHVQGCPRSG